jgi:hypothetical protein
VENPDLLPSKVARRCSELGEAKVRDNLAKGLFTSEWRPHAERWLAKFDHERRESSQAESLEIAKSAKDAAWVAAEAARDAAREASKANTIATLALIAAVIAIAVSIVAVFLG